MKKSDNKNSLGSKESLSDILQKRLELDHEIESKYTNELTLMFTDIKDSTQYQETHGDLSGRMLLEKHNQIFCPIITECKGKIIKSTGDGMLVVFNRPKEGVKAAIIMQKKLWEYNEGKSKQEQLHVRIAINHGKVIEDEGDIHGLAVSATARIESITKADQVLISQSVYEELKNSKDIFCKSIPPVQVKGLQERMKLYRVIWNDEEEVAIVEKSSVTQSERLSKQRTVFVIEINKEAEKIKVSGYEKIGSEQKTVRHYEEVRIDDAKISEYNSRVIDLLNRASKRGRINKDILEKLKAVGQRLYDEIFSVELKRKLAATKSEDMIISIDDHLVYIPWELLHDGNSFFCLRFNMGRLVSTRQTVSEIAVRRVEVPLKMLIVADPQGNLQSACREGIGIRNKLESLGSNVNIETKSNSVKPAFLLEKIRNFDILHYAGHADYDIKNPSNSGFLMENGKLKASDIINLIGPKPLPSLVFSNACKSGHTDVWKVKEDYETEIFGLANAFLLAGVQHYIGTFWDVQDELSSHFATYFYKELMNGAMIGEAVRNAKLQIIENYGEESVIWASYMLYGDPTFKYVDFSKSDEKKEEKTENAIREERSIARGGVRAMEEVDVFQYKKLKWPFIGSGFLLLLLIILVLFSITKTREDSPTVQIPAKVEQESKEAKKKRIDELVAILIKNYKEGQTTGKSETVDGWRSSATTLVFLNIKVKGISEMEKEYILSRVTDNLQGSKRVQIVEREILDKLLEELKLSSSELADSSKALKIGRILSAKLITTGSIVRDRKDWLVNLRMIETETTSIKAALTKSFRTNKKEDVAEGLSYEVLQRVRAEYPLQGRALSLEDGKVVLDLGSKDGVTVGLKMEVLSEVSKTLVRLGEIEITSVEENRSFANITSKSGDLKKGVKVKEIL